MGRCSLPRNAIASGPRLLGLADRMYRGFGAVHHWDLPAGQATYRVFLLPGWLEVDIAFVPEAEFGPLGPHWRTVFGTAVRLDPPSSLMPGRWPAGPGTTRCTRRSLPSTRGVAMNPKLPWFAVIAVATVIAFALGLGAGLGLGLRIGSGPGAGRALCTANPCRVTMTRNGSDGLVIKDARGPKEENSLLIIDPSGLAEFWQNAAGAYEGPRGEICTTNSSLAPVACLGGDGTGGWVRIGDEVLTSGDLAWMHRAEGATRPAAQPEHRRVPAVPAGVALTIRAR